MRPGCTPVFSQERVNGAKKTTVFALWENPGPGQRSSKNMASMISGDFAEAYVRKNACREEERRAEAKAAADGGSAVQGEKKEKAGGGASGKKTAAEETGGKGDGGGLFGLIRKKVHPKAAAS